MLTSHWISPGCYCLTAPIFSSYLRDQSRRLSLCSTASAQTNGITTWSSLCGTMPPQGVLAIPAWSCSIYGNTFVGMCFRRYLNVAPHFTSLIITTVPYIFCGRSSVHTKGKTTLSCRRKGHGSLSEKGEPSCCLMRLTKTGHSPFSRSPILSRSGSPMWKPCYVHPMVMARNTFLQA